MANNGRTRDELTLPAHIPVSREDREAWDWMLERTGLRQTDMVRRCIRVAHEIERAMDRGASVAFVETDGTHTKVRFI